MKLYEVRADMTIHYKDGDKEAHTETYVLQTEKDLLKKIQDYLPLRKKKPLYDSISEGYYVINDIRIIRKKAKAGAYPF